MHRNRAIVASIALILFLVLVGVVIANIFGGGHKKQAPKPAAATVMALPDYAGTTATTSMTIDGQVNGDDLHQAIRITIGQNQREVDVIQGYSGHVISSQTFYNNQNAYFVFLTAINNGGFLLKYKPAKNVPAAPADERGQCPLGNRYIFELDQNGSTISRLWTSDCGVADGTFGGNESLMQTLFEAQIPQYGTLTENVNLGSD